MRRIYKYPLYGQPGDTVNIEMPRGAQIIHAALQDTTPTLWAIVEPAATPEKRLFGVWGTGWDIPDGDVKYYGTVFTGGYVWHVLEFPR